MGKCLFVVVLLFAASCKNSKPNDNAGQEQEWQVPPAGTIVAADSISLKKELTKGLHFSIQLKVPETPSQSGVQHYLLQAKYGHGEAHSEIVMPRGGTHLQPLIRRKDEHHFVIGFVPGKAFGHDTSFYEYYQVSGNMQGISVEALNGFQIN